MIDRPAMPTRQVLGVIVVARCPSVRAVLRTMIERQPDVAVIAEWTADPVDTGTIPDALVIALDPDRLTLPGRLAERFPQVAQVLLIDSPTFYRRLTGPLERATAVLLKDAGPDEIGLALRAAVRGLVVLDPAIAHASGIHGTMSASLGSNEGATDPLTERERQVLELLAQGLPNKTIAMELSISEHTAKFHVGAIMSKLDAASRTEAVAIAARRGLLVL